MYSTLLFKALGSDVEAVVVGKSKNIDKIFETIKEQAELFENKFSRFRHSSELSRFNLLESGWQPVDKEFLDLVTIAKAYFEETNGLFNPAIIGVLNKFYHASFEKIPKNQKIIDRKVSGGITGRFELLKIDHKKSRIFKPDGLQIDLGGIGKGYFVDKCAKLLNSLDKDYWFSIGGDMVVSSREGQAWRVAVQNPANLAQDVLNISLKNNNGAIATSGVTKRGGVILGKKWNHLIDPRANQPIFNDLLAVTVISSSATKSDVFAKAALILGLKDGLEFIDQNRDSSCIAIDRSLNYHLSKGFENMAEIL